MKKYFCYIFGFLILGAGLALISINAGTLNKEITVKNESPTSAYAVNVTIGNVDLDTNQPSYGCGTVWVSMDYGEYFNFYGVQQNLTEVGTTLNINWEVNSGWEIVYFTYAGNTYYGNHAIVTVSPDGDEIIMRYRKISDKPNYAIVYTYADREYIQNVTYNSPFTFQPGSIFTRFGYEISKWVWPESEAHGFSPNVWWTTGSYSSSYGFQYDIFLIPEWTKAGDIITLDNQGANSTGTRQVVAAAGKTMPTISPPSKSGHTFQGYFLQQNGSGKKYYNTDGTSAANWDQSEDTTLYAYWIEDLWEDHYSTFASGSGTSSNPYIIKTGAQLGYLAKLSRSSTLSETYYELGSNIDLSSYVWRGIGNSSYNFSGNFSGNNFTIKAIRTIGTNRGMDQNQGLFGITYNASITNVIIENSTFDTASTAGSVIGEMKNGTLENCIVNSVTLNGYSNIGGLVGRLTNGTISTCMLMKVNVNGTGSAIGGLVGNQNDGKIYSCASFDGKVQTSKAGSSSSTTMCGGLVGYLYKGTIEDCSVQNATVQAPSTYASDTDVNILYGYKANGSVSSSYGIGEVTILYTTSTKKKMYGSATTWTNWTYIENYNGSYPVQYPLFRIGGLTDYDIIYSHLINLNFDFSS